MPLEKIIEGYNREKEIIVTQLTEMTDCHFESKKIKISMLEKRLVQIEEKIQVIFDKMFTSTN